MAVSSFKSDFGTSGIMPGEAQKDIYDLVVIGGGINGVGIARDAAGRGLKVLVCEKSDLASATSSASTKLIHGGLRYLEYYEFRLVREALIEREVLLQAAPHIIWPLRFVLPHVKSLRPAWMVRLGLFLYDHLGGRKILPGTRSLNMRRDPAGQSLRDDITKAFEYSDCWVDDARLVVLNAMDAVERGAEVVTRTTCTLARREGDLWSVNLQPEGEEPYQVKARALVNAGGPWVSDILGKVIQVNRPAGLRLVKGSHFVVPRLYEGAQAYIFQNEDRRIVFTIPYERNFTLVGTTDLTYEGDPSKVAIEDDEVSYLLKSVNAYFKQQISKEDIVWTFSGVRPLYDDQSANVSAVTRDYVFDIDASEGQAPLLSVFGGKLTTYRKLAEHALGKLQPLMGFADKTWTSEGVLPGGDMPNADFESYLADVQGRYFWLPADLLRRYARAYGTRIDVLLKDKASMADLGEDFGSGIYEAEVAYLEKHEWLRTAEDLLWRRSKLGLRAGKETVERLKKRLPS
ncbi:glycerol-3-phosphate dehydrogenase [Rhodovibrionaceae bacterium A322]